MTMPSRKEGAKAEGPETMEWRTPACMYHLLARPDLHYVKFHRSTTPLNRFRAAVPRSLFHFSVRSCHFNFLSDSTAVWLFPNPISSGLQLRPPQRVFPFSVGYFHFQFLPIPRLTNFNTHPPVINHLALTMHLARRSLLGRMPSALPPLEGGTYCRGNRGYLQGRGKRVVWSRRAGGIIPMPQFL